jgi:predicted alpha/beta superfamily hydrolase
MARGLFIRRFWKQVAFLGAWLAAVACQHCFALPGAEVSDSPVRVIFRLHAPELPSDTSVYLTGSTSELGNWDPQQVKMSTCGNHRWAYCLKSPPLKMIEYKYTLGSWEKEGADATGQPLSNFTLRADKNLVAEDHIDFWTQAKPRVMTGQITGTVRYHRQLKAAGLRPRDVIVWLPPDYEHSRGRYPVLYMHDGQNLVDPTTSAFGVDWQIDETCTRLIAERAIPPLIVVGIYNTPNRSQEYLPGAMGTAYMRFVAEVVKPLIDREYRTLSDRAQTFVGGSSAGGLCAFMLAWEYPQVFSRAMCVSPAFKLEDNGRDIHFDYVQTVRNSPLPRIPLFFYIDNGGVGLEQVLQGGIDEMLAALQEKGLRPNRDYVSVRDQQARHSESDWARRLPQALRELLSEREE